MRKRQWGVAAMLATAAAGTAVLIRQSRRSSPSPVSSDRLQLVGAFDHQVTGVTVARDGRIFVNFPRWTEDAPVSVAELLTDGDLRPFPDDEWNRWRNAGKNSIDPRTHWVCVQSVVVDQQGALWVLDPAAPATAAVVPGGPKLVKIDLSANSVVKTIHFDEGVAPQGSYLNDVRFSPDGQHAYITDSGAVGALVVVALTSGTARRVLHGHPTTQPEKDVVVKTGGRELRRPDGRGAEFAADGIALSADGDYLYWQALTGRTLYRIATSALVDAGLSAEALAQRVERAGENGVSDGLLMDARGRIYITALEENAIKRREADGRVTTLFSDPRLRWPDTLAEGPDGSIYVTTSHIQDMAWYNPRSGPRLATELWRFTP
jgi:sugar lactone lactonase YvrE